MHPEFASQLSINPKPLELPPPCSGSDEGGGDGPSQKRQNRYVQGFNAPRSGQVGSCGGDRWQRLDAQTGQQPVVGRVRACERGRGELSSIVDNRIYRQQISTDQADGAHWPRSNLAHNFCEKEDS